MVTVPEIWKTEAAGMGGTAVVSDLFLASRHSPLGILWHLFLSSTNLTPFPPIIACEHTRHEESR